MARLSVPKVWNPRSRIMPRASPFDSHRRQPGFASRLGQALSLNRQNDPVALPITQVGELVERLILDVQTPIANLMHIGADPPEDLPVVGSLEMDHHGNLPPLGHRNLPNPERRKGERGQVQFAGTARRVLRTNWTCPLSPRNGETLHVTKYIFSRALWNPSTSPAWPPCPGRSNSFLAGAAKSDNPVDHSPILVGRFRKCFGKLVIDMMREEQAQ